MKWAAGVFFSIGLCITTITSCYAQSNVQFSGQAVQSAPDGKSRHSTLFVGDNQMRLEYRRGKQDVVEIYDMKNQRAMLLFPQEKIYKQRVASPGKSANPMLPPKGSNPCSAMPEGQCKKTGTETLYGRPVSKWEVTLKRGGKTFHSMHWIDDERLMSLRDVWPDGSVSEFVLQDTEVRDGRMTERWQRTTTHPDGKKVVSTQWYDPELQMTVREELPGGFFREIKSIHVARQPAALFQVPADYQLVEINGKRNNGIVGKMK